jgi:glucose/arabinose dehydrogenase
MSPRRLLWLTLAVLLAVGPSLAGRADAATPIAPAAPVAQAAPADAPDLQVDSVVGGLATIWAVDFAPDGRIFLTERGGRIRTITNGALDPDPWMSLEVAERAGSESGLLGLALDKEFATNGYVYTAYTYVAGNGGLQNRLVRLKEDPSTHRGMMDTVLLDDARGGQVHDGGRVKIGPDGKLYWTMGESGSPDLAQSLDSLNGKILRLDLDGSIPADNPFPGSPIYSYGNRNPQGLAWQPGTGLLFETEHGPSGQQSCCDEVNLIVPGQNYGWPQAYGDTHAEGTIPPLLHSGPNANTVWAPGGATFVTQGPWAGSLVFAALKGQSLNRVTLDPTPSPQPTVLGLETYFQGQYGRLRDVVEGPDGALYISTSNKDGRGRPHDNDDQLLKLTVR